MKYKDYYEALALPRSATQDDIKRAYRKLARKYHPDLSKLDDAEARFKNSAKPAFDFFYSGRSRQHPPCLGERLLQSTFAARVDIGNGLLVCDSGHWLKGWLRLEDAAT